MLLIENINKLEEKTSIRFILVAFIIFFINSLNFLIIKKENFLSQIYNRQNSMIKVCNEFIYQIPSNSYENVNYIKYWHMRIDDEKINKICKEII